MNPITPRRPTRFSPAPALALLAAVFIATPARAGIPDLSLSYFIPQSGPDQVTFTASNFLAGSRTTIIRVIGAVTGVDAAEAPAAARLAPNRPNPFNPGTEIEFSLPKDAVVRLAIYDSSGRLIRVLAREPLPAGRHEARWDGKDRHGRPAASGVYLCRLEAGGARLARRMVLLR